LDEIVGHQLGCLHAQHIVRQRAGQDHVEKLAYIEPNATCKMSCRS
jgi:hypothetical protein